MNWTNLKFKIGKRQLNSSLLRNLAYMNRQANLMNTCVIQLLQWRIQDFSEGGANPQGGDANLLLGQIFPENCMKMKEIGPT